jgi:hypothetical protein
VFDQTRTSSQHPRNSNVRAANLLLLLLALLTENLITLHGLGVVVLCVLLNILGVNNSL